MDTAIKYELSADLEVRVVTAPYFLATKIEAFLGRGKGDYLWSHDLEDLIFVIDGRSAMIQRPVGRSRGPALVFALGGSDAVTHFRVRKLLNPLDQRFF
ncbi:MAG: hypothetical protein JWN34_3629 [Bryobacterales bacterium]|nr:hypothetical protein [Bryobacterales bacterium]